MSDLRWAARLAFCEELWRDRARIVWDRRVEAVLAEGRVEAGEDDALSRLVDAVVPQRAALDGARKRIDVSMGVGEEAMARRLAPRRPGTQFLTFGPLCEAIRRRNWDVALLDLSDLLMVDEPGGPSRLSMRGTELVDAVASRLTEGGDDEDDAADGPAVVFGVLAQTPGADEAIAYGVDFGGLLELLEPLLRRDVPVRLYGMLRPTMAAMVEFSVEDADDEDAYDDDLVDDLERTHHDPRSGPPPDGTFPIRASHSSAIGETEDEAKTAELRPQSEGVSVRRGSGTWRDGPRREWSAAGELEVTSPLRPPSPEAVTARIARRPDVDAPLDERGDAYFDEREDGEDVPLSFDNTLGATEPAIVEYVVVAGAGIDDAVADGMTLVELPDAAAAFEAELATDGAPAPLRAQLAESRRQVDLSAIERQRLVERLDNVESSNTELRTEAADLRDRLARALTESAPAQGQERLDVAQAELQSLRWQLTQAQRSLDAARARPVEELEAEVATLTARLEGGQAGPVIGSNGRSNGQAAPAVSTSPTGLSADGPSPRPDAPSATRSLLARVDAIVQRVERSDISALELRKRLIELREGLTRLLPGTGR